MVSYPAFALVPRLSLAPSLGVSHTFLDSTLADPPSRFSHSFVPSDPFLHPLSLSLSLPTFRGWDRPPFFFSFPFCFRGVGSITTTPPPRRMGGNRRQDKEGVEHTVGWNETHVIVGRSGREGERETHAHAPRGGGGGGPAWDKIRNATRPIDPQNHGSHAHSPTNPRKEKK